MSNKITAISDVIKTKRLILLSCLGIILLGSLGIGLSYQNKMDKEKESAIYFDEAWQQVITVVNDLSQQENKRYLPNDPKTKQVQQYFQQALETLDMLTLDFSRTTAGARAALLLVTIANQPELNAILADTNYLSLYTEEGYFDTLKKKHPKFWGAAIAMVEAVKAEQSGNFAQAITYYEEASKLDKQNYIQDYILISLARNYEILNDIENAKFYYQNLIDQFENSPWVNFAIAKVYLLSNIKS